MKLSKNQLANKVNRRAFVNKALKTLKGSDDNMRVSVGKVSAGAKGLRTSKEVGKVVRTGIRNQARTNIVAEKETTKRTTAIANAQKEAALASIAKWNGVIKQDPLNPVTPGEYGITGTASIGTTGQSALGGVD